jgi:hypothetical protein
VKPADPTAFIGAFIGCFASRSLRITCSQPRHAHLSLDRAAIRITIP